MTITTALSAADRRPSTAVSRLAQTPPSPLPLSTPTGRFHATQAPTTLPSTADLK